LGKIDSVPGSYRGHKVDSVKQYIFHTHTSVFTLLFQFLGKLLEIVETVFLCLLVIVLTGICSWR